MSGPTKHMRKRQMHVTSRQASTIIYACRAYMAKHKGQQDEADVADVLAAVLQAWPEVFDSAMERINGEDAR